MNKKLDDKDLVKVTGGTKEYDEQMLDIRKDLYENVILAVGAEDQNIILKVGAEDHNVMLTDAPEK